MTTKRMTQAEKRVQDLYVKAVHRTIRPMYIDDGYRWTTWTNAQVTLVADVFDVDPDDVRAEVEKDARTLRKLAR